MAVGMLTAIAACAAQAHIISGLTERIQPEFASHIWPGNDEAWARAASRELAKVDNFDKLVLSGEHLSEGAGGAPLRKARFYAEQAVRSSAVQEEGLRNLAYLALLGGEGDKAERIARVAYGVSRRDVGTQILLVVRALSRQDVASTLLHVDEALRTSSGVREPLYTVLAQALSHSEFKSLFRQYIRKDNEWLAEFLLFALENRIQTRIVGEIIAEAGPLPDRAGASIRELAPAYLIAADEVGLARRIASRLPQGSAPAINGGLSDPDFRQPQVVAPFGWTFPNSDAIDIRRPTRIASALYGSSSLPFEGEILRQLLVLPSGRYIFRFDGELGENTGWNLRCTSTGRTLMDNNVSFSKEILVPSEGCTGQWLTLESRALGVVKLKLRSVQLVPN
jgi:hypothetical protein